MFVYVPYDPKYLGLVDQKRFHRSSVFKAAKIVFRRSNVGPFCARPKLSTGHRFDVISGSENTSVMADNWEGFQDMHHFNVACGRYILS